MTVNLRLIGLVVILHVALVVLAGCVSTSAKKVSQEEIADANVNLAVEYFRLGRMEPALNSAKKAVAAQSESVAANSMLALIYQALEQPLLAEEHFSISIEHVQEDTGEFGDIHNNYAIFLCQNDRILDAEEHFLLAANNKLYSTPQNAYENAGVCALNGGRGKESEAFFRKALALASNMPRSLFELAKIQYNAEQFLSARAYFQRFHAVDQGSAKSLFMAMTVEEKLGAPEEALRIKNELKKRFPDSLESKSL